MPRPATGSPRWNPKTRCWEARVTIPGSGRVVVPLVDEKGQPTVPPCVLGAPGARCTCSSCTLARRAAKIISDRSRDEGRVPADTRITVSEWFTAYYDAAAIGTV